MQSTESTFNERVAEIDLYYDALQELYDSRIQSEITHKYHEEDFLKILKSNALIMIYNLVESTVMGGILEIYDDLQQHGITYRQVRREIRDVWFAFKFSQVYDRSAHYNSYRDKASEIISSILDDNVLAMDRKATDISGNLDAEKIRRICQDHGILFRTDPTCRGGIVLTDVKNKRNDLAHGTSSFVECGRDYTIDDLIKIKKQTALFLNGILEGMKEYYMNQQYLIATNQDILSV